MASLLGGVYRERVKYVIFWKVALDENCFKTSPL